MKKLANGANRSSSMSVYEKKSNYESSRMESNLVHVPFEESISSQRDPSKNKSYRDNIRKCINKFVKEKP